MNWKRLWMTIKRDLIHSQKQYLFVLGLMVLVMTMALIDNYSPFMDAGTGIGAMSGALLACAFMFTAQLSQIFDHKKSAVPYMMVPASNLEKYISKIVTLVAIPFAFVFIMNAIVSTGHETLFARQIGVEKNAENMERFHPGEIECSSLITHQSYTYKNDSVAVTFHGRFHDVEIRKFPSQWIQVGISSSTFGDIMFIIGIIGTIVFLMLLIKNQYAGAYAGIAGCALMTIGVILPIEKIFYNTMSISATENYILIASTAEGLIGIFLLWRSYKLFCNKNIE
ncbi:MAG: hypothetical protein MJZ01_03900 [Bacteroidales bacterium]|nr:hypothetical protein [Bacteroidales bacterium]